MFYLGGVGGAYLNRNITKSAPIKLTPHSTNMRIINSSLAVASSASSFKMIEGTTYPIPDPIMLIVAKIAVQTGL